MSETTRDPNVELQHFDELTKDLLEDVDAPSAKTIEMGEAPAFPDDSASTESDAGVIDVIDESDSDIDEYDDLDSTDLDKDLPSSPNEEIPSGNLDIESLDDPLTRDRVRSPDMDAPDTPGEIDIEALGEDDLDLTDLPDDARLDPLEE